MKKDLNEDMLVGQTPEENAAEIKLTEDVLTSTNESKDRIAKIAQESANRKRKAMRESVGIIYSKITEEAKAKELDNIGVMQIKNLNVDGHIAEIVHEGKAFKVGTEKFVVMTKSYISDIVKENRKLKSKVFEQGDEIKRLAAKMQMLESRQTPVYSEGNETLLKEVRELKGRLTKIEKHNEER